MHAVFATAGAGAQSGPKRTPGAGLSKSSSSTRSGLAGLTLGAIGVVYGDIGTSPLYALKEVFAHGHVSLTADNIYGVLLLVF